MVIAAVHLRCIRTSGCFILYLIFDGTTAPDGPGPSHFRGFTITLKHTTLGSLLWTSDQPDAETAT
jgi:hypothetical protein